MFSELKDGENSTINKISIFYNDSLSESKQFPDRFWTNIQLRDGTKMSLEFDLVDQLSSSSPNETLQLWTSNFDKTYKRFEPIGSNRHVSNFWLKMQNHDIFIFSVCRAGHRIEWRTMMKPLEPEHWSETMEQPTINKTHLEW